MIDARDKVESLQQIYTGVETKPENSKQKPDPRVERREDESCNQCDENVMCGMRMRCV